jgi:hypothetical protein
MMRLREHHAKEDFRFELPRLLRAHGVDFDERYSAGRPILPGR